MQPSFKTPRRGGIALAAALLLGVGAPTALAGETYAVDPAHSAVLFAVTHLGVSRIHGRFTKISGQVTLEKPGSFLAGEVSIEIEAGSLYTASRKRDDHLRGPDFFNVKEFPKITFTGTASAKGEGAEVTGSLTLLGKTRPVTITMKQIGAGKDPWGGFRIGYEGTIPIKRSDFGMSYMAQAVGDEVELVIAIEAIRK